MSDLSPAPTPCKCAAGRYSHPGRDCAPTPTNEQQDTRDPEAENAVAQIVMAYGDGGWLPLDLRYGIAVEVLTRLRSLGFTRPSALDADREFRWHEANGPVIDDDRYMPVTIARRLAAVSAAAPDEREALAEAERRWPDHTALGDNVRNVRIGKRDGFVDGMAWALAARPALGDSNGGTDDGTRTKPDGPLMPPETLVERLEADGRLWRLAFEEGAARPAPVVSGADVGATCCVVGLRATAGWLAEVHEHCTCGGSGVVSPAHQPGCGLVPVAPLANIEGLDRDADLVAALREHASEALVWAGEPGYSAYSLRQESWAFNVVADWIEERRTVADAPAADEQIVGEWTENEVKRLAPAADNEGGQER